MDRAVLLATEFHRHLLANPFVVWLIVNSLEKGDNRVRQWRLAWRTTSKRILSGRNRGGTNCGPWRARTAGPRCSQCL